MPINNATAAGAQHQQSVVAAFLDFWSRDAVADRLHAGQRLCARTRTTGRPGRPTRSRPACGVHRRPTPRGSDRPARRSGTSIAKHDEHADDEGVGRDGERDCPIRRIPRRFIDISSRIATTANHISAARCTVPPNRCWIAEAIETTQRSERNPPSAHWPPSPGPSAPQVGGLVTTATARTGRRARSAGSRPPPASRRRPPARSTASVRGRQPATEEHRGRSPQGA